MLVPELHVNGRRIADDEPAYVIAEIGHNHQGDLEKATELIRAAKECGVDAVKFQKRDNRRLFTRAFFESPYDNENSFGPTYGTHREALELETSDWFELSRYSREQGVAFVAAAFDETSADFLAELGIDAFKFASGDLLNVPFLRYVAAVGKPVFLSTGGGTIEDIDRAVEAILAVNVQVCVLHCTASYPADIEDLNLSVISALKERYPELVVGLSDHHNGIAMAPVAYMLGARAFEKHFTLNHAWKGTDHAYSLMPDGMRRFVRDLRRVPDALGDGIKRRLPSEERPLMKMGKKLVAARDLPAGHLLQPGDLVAKSPADGGLPPYEIDRLLGKRLLRALAFEENIALEDIELVDELVARGSHRV
ncbi:MAG: N-acetylneuraminate synthase family protein [Actinomycetota bacterium]|nr:N-acetylneuraminate synthase family protein [Actinomycetota bacterium]